MKPVSEAVLVSNMPYRKVILRQMRKSELYLLASVLGMSREDVVRSGTKTVLAKRIYKLQKAQTIDND